MKPSALHTRAAWYGRIVFGASAVLFAVVSLVWHSSGLWQNLHLTSIPAGTFVAWFLTVAQIAAGIGIGLRRTARPGSVVLGAVYALLSLACIPGIVAAPSTYAAYGDFFEQFCVVCGSLAVFATTETDARHRVAFGRAARIGLGLCAISFTLAQIVYLKFTASLVPPWIPPSQMFWAIVTTIAFALAAVALLIDRRAQLATRLMTLMLALFGLLVWVPHTLAHPSALADWSEFALNYLIAGAAWMVSVPPAPGKNYLN